MNQESILLPALALVWWTFAILLLIPYRRFKSAFDGEVTVADFKLGESANVPTYCALANRNYMNLLELPLLFYTACLTFYVTETADAVAVNLAWAYVAVRVGHSLVHVTYNNVYHRLGFFATSNFILLALWVLISISLF